MTQLASFLALHAAPSDEALAGRRVVVMGLGRFGGGIAVTRFLAERGARVLVTDLADRSALADSLAQVSDLDIDLRLGTHDTADLAAADLLVISPAVDVRRSAFVAAAVERRVAWTTEINLLLTRCPAQVAAVTGSVGKSTTCAMLFAILQRAAATLRGDGRQVHLGGNIGVSLLGALPAMSADDLVVLELSSFQLELLAPLRWRPDVAGLTNTLPHHLDRHGDYPAYLAAKFDLFRHQRPNDVAVVAAMDAAVRQQLRGLATKRGVEVIDAYDVQTPWTLRTPGPHNQLNAELAARMAAAFGVEEEVSQAALAEFSGLPHRLQWVGEINGAAVYNDSKATSPAALATALRAFEQPICVLLGGKDIGAELDSLKAADWHCARRAICFGEAGPRIANLLAGAVADIRVAPDLVAATTVACRAVRPGEVIVLSPACPSYDAYVNYEARGVAFAGQVAELRCG